MAGLMPLVSSAQGTDGFVLEEVVVSAQKRSQRLIDVPVSVAAVSSESMEAAGVQRFSNIAGQVPNLTVRASSGLVSSVFIRGVGSHSRTIGFDPRVGVYLDGVYMGPSPALNQELIGLERIEILKGPQGALFGKNTVAGAIDMVSRKPDSEFGGGVKASIGNYGGEKYTVDVNVPFSSSVAGNLVVSQNERDGYSKNLFNGDEANEVHSTAFRAQLAVDTIDKLELRLSLDGMTSDENVNFGEALTDTFGATLSPTADQNRKFSQNHTSRENKDILGAAISADYTFDNEFSIRSITSQRSTDYELFLDVDYSDLDLLTTNYQDDVETFTQEFQLVSPAGERFEYIAGLYYFDQKGETQRIAQGGSLSFLLGFPPGGAVTNSGSVDTESMAVFSNMTYDLTEKLELGFGFRFSSEEKSVDWKLDSMGGLLGIATIEVVDDRRDDNFSPTLTLSYAFNDDITGYFRYAEGYKSGGYNVDFVSELGLPDRTTVSEAAYRVASADYIRFDEETVKNYEVGVKGSLLDRRLHFSSVVFWTDYSDFQVNQSRDLGGGRSAIVLTNAARVRTKGVELELTYYATEFLKVSSGMGALDTEFLEFPGGGIFGADVSGNELTHAPDFQANLALDYERELPSLSGFTLRAHVDWSYSDSAYTTADNQETIELLAGGRVSFGSLDEHDVVNARVGLLSENGRWEVSLWARNLFDKEYLVESDRDFFGTIKENLGDPRRYGVDISYTFW